jgi:hypothetical protein
MYMYSYRLAQPEDPYLGGVVPLCLGVPSDLGGGFLQGRNIKNYGEWHFPCYSSVNCLLEVVIVNPLQCKSLRSYPRSPLLHVRHW